MGYAELHCLSNFSFLRGASHPAELVAQAAHEGYRALALTDECSLAGVVKAHVAARMHGLHLIVGAEFRLDSDCLLVLLAPDRAAYAELSGLITLARRRSPKGEYTLGLHDIEQVIHCCLAIWLPGSGAEDGLAACGEALRNVFTDRLWLGVELLLGADDQAHYQRLCGIARRLALRMVACGGVLMHVAERKALADTLCAIRLGEPVQQLGTRLEPNAERHLRPLARLRRIYPPALLAETLLIASRCSFSLSELRYEYPAEVVPPGITATGWLAQLVDAGAQRRWPAGVPQRVRALLDKELVLIAELGYEHYFLTVHDIVQFARSNGILCQGRGSAANSAVCYCLFITEVDPDRIAVLFERFISRERNEPPDIDVDFEHERREEVIQYIYRKYSRERAALAATLIRYRPRSAVRDVGRALGLDPLFVDRLAKSLSWWDCREELARRFTEENLDAATAIAEKLLSLVNQILGFPRHLSQHVGGFIIARGLLAALVPVENAAMPGRTVIQWDKDDIEALGLLKVDILALGILSALRRSFALISAAHGVELDMQSIPHEDPATYAMIGRADTMGVFQIESRAQMAMLPRLRPRCFLRSGDRGRHRASRADPGRYGASLPATTPEWLKNPSSYPAEALHSRSARAHAWACRCSRSR
jgi:error-prone DNA polymerase